MSKAREFANRLLSDVSQSQKPLITMNHKTLEDVKELIDDYFPNEDTTLLEILTELEKLKL